MLLLVIFTCYIVTINSQCSQYYPSTCAAFSAPTQTCTSDNTAYHCDESSLTADPPVSGGSPCVEYTDQCTMCARLCQLSGYSLLATPKTEDEVYVMLTCGTGVCTSAPTESPIVAGTPTKAPTMRPTTACSKYTCDPTQAPNLNCNGQPTGVYSCDTNGGGCEELDSECSACCSADKTNEVWGLSTRQDAFDFACDIDIACPTQTPSKTPSKTPTESPIAPDTPTKAPTVRPTTACSKYSCEPAQAPNFNCNGQPSGVYSCRTALSIGACEDLDSECSACCSADKTNEANGGYFGTRQEAFDAACDIDIICPTQSPSKYPTQGPTQNPSKNPSETPSKYPTQGPTLKPSKNPLIPGDTHNPTTTPSADPTTTPSKYPSEIPSKNPSETPTQKPTNNPLRPGETHAPTDTPTVALAGDDDSQGGDNNPDESQMISIILPILFIMIVAIVTY